MELLIEKRDVYGTVRFYPACEKSRLLARLTEKKTFRERDLYILKDLGYTIKFKQYEEFFNERSTQAS